jgi:NADPH-ferrihemoprotein reductase
MTNAHGVDFFPPAAPRPLAAVAMASSSSDVAILGVGVVLAALYIFRDQLFAASKPKAAPITSTKSANGSGNPRDFVTKMKEGVSHSIFHMSSC